MILTFSPVAKLKPDVDKLKIGTLKDSTPFNTQYFRLNMPNSHLVSKLGYTGKIGSIIGNALKEFKEISDFIN